MLCHLAALFAKTFNLYEKMQLFISGHGCFFLSLSLIPHIPVRGRMYPTGRLQYCWVSRVPGEQAEVGEPPAADQGARDPGDVAHTSKRRPTSSCIQTV